MPTKTVQESLEEHTHRWMDIAGVVGTAIGESDGRPCILVLVARKSDELMKQIPGSVDGHPVVIEETGEFRAL